MIKPTLHLNGTGKKMLVEGYEKAHRAIREASKALGEIEFNARDYYVQGPQAWPQAIKEMECRIGMLGRIEREIEEIIISLIQ